MAQAQKQDKLFLFDGGVLDDIVGSAADALVAADGLHVGHSLDFLEGLLGALSALGQGPVSYTHLDVYKRQREEHSI